MSISCHRHLSILQQQIENLQEEPLGIQGSVRERSSADLVQVGGKSPRRALASWGEGTEEHRDGYCSKCPCGERCIICVMSCKLKAKVTGLYFDVSEQLRPLLQTGNDKSGV